MSNNPSLNSAIIAKEFTKEQQFDGYLQQSAYPCNNIKEISDYVLSLRTDKRSIATGVDSTTYSPFQTLRSGSSDIRTFAKASGVCVNLAIQLIEPKSVLVNQSILNADIMVMLFKGFSSDISIINGPYLHLYEKFVKPDDGFPQIPYKSISKRELILSDSPKYDLEILWSDDIEGEYDYVSSLLNSLNPGGVMLIANSANQALLYGVDNYMATPQAELHEFIKSDNRFITYHLVNFVGFTFVKKIRD
jgi:hypothetical protein